MSARLEGGREDADVEVHLVYKMEDVSTKIFCREPVVWVKHDGQELALT